MLEAARTAGADPTDPPALDPAALVGHFGRIATVEVAAITSRPRPVVEAELWALATEWRVRAVPVLTGTMWESA